MKMKIQKLVCTLIIGLLSFSGIAQQTTVFTEANMAFKRGKEFYDKGLAGKAQHEFMIAINLLQPSNEPESDLLKMKAELFYAKSAVRLDLSEGENLVLDFARKYDPDPLANEAIIEMANYYYNDRNYEKAIQLFSSIDTYDLTKDQRSEVKFKLGYCYFYKKNFSSAAAAFRDIKDVNNEYYFPTNYYYGITQFYVNKYPEAIKSFERVQASNKYKVYVPYYITQIYFAQGLYDEVIDYGAKKAQDASLKNKPEINQLVGQAYFEKGDYNRALPHLEYYNNNTMSMRAEEYFQLGFTQKETGDCVNAAKNFENLNNENSALGQNAMYSLADCQIQNGDKQRARNAFKVASRMDFDRSIKEESAFNYGKLSYELNYDLEAVPALQSIQPDSKYYTESQTMLSNIFLNTRDYENAISILDKIPNKTPKMRETYQKVAFYRGLQLLKDGNPTTAKLYFQKSLESPVDNKTKALCYYWLGDIANQEEKYNESAQELNKFTTLAKTISNLPDESSLHTANYTMGYNYLKQKNYSGALGYFQEAISGIRQNSMFINSDYITKNILGDATLRAGDCLFKRNQYSDAVRFYDDAIQNKYSGYVYALYQKAIIEGLRGKTTDKILALESIADDYPNSVYADNALLQLGNTYQEIGQYDQSSNALKRLLREHKNSELYNEALIKLGLISYNQGSISTAIDYYKQVFSHNPNSKQAEAALTALEEIYVDDLGKTDEYFAFLETIPGYSVNSDEKEAISFKAAESQYENGNYDKAITGFTNYLGKYPNTANSILAYYHRGESFSVLKRYSEALNDYEYVANKGPGSYYAKALRKAALIAYNFELNFQKAYTLYSQLESAAPDSETRFEAQLGAMRSAYRINNSEAVIAMAEKVSKNPSADDAQKATAYFYIGKLNMDGKRYDKALSAFNEVIRMSSDEQTAEARYLVAYIYYVQRDLDVAQQLCLNANRESAGYNYWIAKSVILLADILAEKGDLFNAQAALEGLIENYDEDQELVNIAKAKLQKIKTQSSNNSLISKPEGDNMEFIEEEGGGGRR
jgi:tetratricopeptide (TPR) repeat protein